MIDTPKDPELCARIADLKNENAALRAELAEAKGERGKDRKEAFEAGRNYGRANPKDGYPMSESSQEAFAAFLQSRKESK